MTAKFTEATTMVEVANAELDSLADTHGAIGSTVVSNDASTERNTLANFRVEIGLQTARSADAQIHLLIVPDDGAGNYGEVVASDTQTPQSYKARYEDGTYVVWELDAAVTARTLTACGVQVPNGNFKVGLLNDTGQALGASGISYIYISGRYGVDDV